MGVALLMFAAIAWAGGILILGDVGKQYDAGCRVMFVVAGMLLIMLGTMLIAELVSGLVLY